MARIIGALSVVFVVCFFAAWCGQRLAVLAFGTSEQPGIYAAPSGQASYLAGEACVINDSKDRSELDMWNDFTFCMHSRAQFYSSKH